MLQTVGCRSPHAVARTSAGALGTGGAPAALAPAEQPQAPPHPHCLQRPAPALQSTLWAWLLWGTSCRRWQRRGWRRRAATQVRPRTPLGAPSFYQWHLTLAGSCSSGPLTTRAGRGCSRCLRRAQQATGLASQARLTHALSHTHSTAGLANCTQATCSPRACWMRWCPRAATCWWTSALPPTRRRPGCPTWQTPVGAWGRGGQGAPGWPAGNRGASLGVGPPGLVPGLWP